MSIGGRYTRALIGYNARARDSADFPGFCAAKELVRSFLQTEGYARVGYWYQAGWPGSLGSREMLLAMAWIIVTWDVTAVALERRLAGWGTMGPLPPYAQVFPSKMVPLRRFGEV